MRGWFVREGRLTVGYHGGGERNREGLSGSEVSFWVGGNVLDLVSEDFQTNTESTTYHRKLYYKMTL